MRRLITIPPRRCSLPFAATIAGDRLAAPLGPLASGDAVRILLRPAPRGRRVGKVYP